MAAESPYRLGAKAEKQVGCLGDCACRVDNIVDKHHVLAFNIADNCHFLYYIGLGALLVAKHEGHIEIFGIGVGALCTAHVGRCDAHVFEMKALQIGNEDRRSV